MQQFCRYRGICWVHDDGDDDDDDGDDDEDEDARDHDDGLLGASGILACSGLSLSSPQVVTKPVVLHFELYPLNPAAEFGG